MTPPLSRRQTLRQLSDHAKSSLPALVRSGTMLFDSKKESWPNPEDSVGRPCELRFKDTQCWEATGPALAVFNLVAPAVDKLIEDNMELLEQGEPKSSGISFNMWMEGSKRSSARPVIVFSSKSRRQRTCAKALLKDSGILDKHPNVSIKALDRMPAIHQAKSLPHIPSWRNHSTLDVFLNDRVSEPVGAQISFGDSKFATMMGIVYLNGKQHALIPQHPRFNYDREDLNSACEKDQLLEFDEDSEIDEFDFVEITSAASISSSEPSDEDDSSSPYSDEDSIFEAPRSATWTPSTSAPNSRPTSYQMDDLFTEPDEESESLPPKPLGDRIRIASLAPESSANDLDYECVPVDDAILQETNRVLLPTADNEGPKYLYPNNIATKPIESTILAVTGTTGLVHGTIFDNPYYIKMNGSSKCQEMWPVRLDRDTMPGDCGAWVVNANTGLVYGHIVAGDPVTGMAFIIPAHKVFSDIEHRFGVRPALSTENHRTQRVADRSQVALAPFSSSIDLIKAIPSSTDLLEAVQPWFNRVAAFLAWIDRADFIPYMMQPVVERSTEINTVNAFHPSYLHIAALHLSPLIGLGLFAPSQSVRKRPLHQQVASWIRFYWCIAMMSSVPLFRGGVHFLGDPIHSLLMGYLLLCHANLILCNALAEAVLDIRVSRRVEPVQYRLFMEHFGSYLSKGPVSTQRINHTALQNQLRAIISIDEDAIMGDMIPKFQTRRSLLSTVTWELDRPQILRSITASQATAILFLLMLGSLPGPVRQSLIFGGCFAKVSPLAGYIGFYLGAMTNPSVLSGLLDGSRLATLVSRNAANVLMFSLAHAPTQQYLYRQSLNSAVIHANNICYVEMHDTRTQADDEAKIESATTVFAYPKRRLPSIRSNQPLHLGDIKANIGHGEAASGASALVKVLLMMKKNVIPPNTHGIRRVCVNNFSAAGGNTAVIMEDAPSVLAPDSVRAPKRDCWREVQRDLSFDREWSQPSFKSELRGMAFRRCSNRPKRLTFAPTRKYATGRFPDEDSLLGWPLVRQYGQCRYPGVCAPCSHQRYRCPDYESSHCNWNADGFRGHHELERHLNNFHGFHGSRGRARDEAWSWGADYGGYYNAYYNAAAHLRRVHFGPNRKRVKGPNKSFNDTGDREENNWSSHAKERIDDLEDVVQPPQDISSHMDEPGSVAIVGLSPKLHSAESAEQLWDMLLQTSKLDTRVPESRFDVLERDSDLLFFNIVPVAPESRVLVQTVYEVLEAAWPSHWDIMNISSEADPLQQQSTRLVYDFSAICLLDYSRPRYPGFLEILASEEAWSEGIHLFVLTFFVVPPVRRALNLYELLNLQARERLLKSLLKRHCRCCLILLEEPEITDL